MKVLNLSVSDFANFSHTNAEALRSVGVHCTDVKLLRHPFQYGSSSTKIHRNQVEALIKQHDIIQIMHSAHQFIEPCHRHKKKMVMYHTGSYYRNAPEQYNGLCDSYTELTFTDQCEFMHLGAKNLHYIATAVPEFNIHPRYAESSPYQVHHYPSNPEVKGTDQIIDMMKHHITSCNFKWSASRVQHEDQMVRLNDCDIYIELFKPILNGKEYGCYGVTAFEAAAIGKIVVTNNIYPEVYKATYGHDAPFVVANTEEEFFVAMYKLVRMDTAELNRLQQYHRIIMEQNHSLKATGNYLKKLLDGI